MYYYLFIYYLFIIIIYLFLFLPILSPYQFILLYIGTVHYRNIIFISFWKYLFFYNCNILFDL